MRGAIKLSEDYKSTLKELIGIREGTDLELVFDTVSQATPYIGRAITAIKIARLEKRLNEYAGRLSSIESLLVGTEEYYRQFIQEKLFPFVLEDLLEEAQEEKVDLLFNGVEYSIRNEITDEAKVISYYDVLRNLRIDEIKVLLKYTAAFKKKEYELIEKRKYRLGLSDLSLDGKEFEEKQGYQNYIENRLLQYGLIFNEADRQIDEFNSEINWHFGGNIRSKLSRLRKNRISLFGEQFVEFFDLTSKIKFRVDD
ncbi:hypothetical protein HXZ66_15655 [Bacillus sp. A116_S68]|nr:hypothetical protein HXZ66_15655 [Bacillus sp. A116_S68]